MNWFTIESQRDTWSRLILCTAAIESNVKFEGQAEVDIRLVGRPLWQVVWSKPRRPRVQVVRTAQSVRPAKAKETTKTASLSGKAGAEEVGERANWRAGRSRAAVV